MIVATGVCALLLKFLQKKFTTWCSNERGGGSKAFWTMHFSLAMASLSSHFDLELNPSSGKKEEKREISEIYFLSIPLLLYLVHHIFIAWLTRWIVASKSWLQRRSVLTLCTIWTCIVHTYFWTLLPVSLFTVSSLLAPQAVWHFVVESSSLNFSTGLISLTTPATWSW